MDEAVTERLAPELISDALQEGMPEMGWDGLRSLQQLVHLRVG